MVNMPIVNIKKITKMLMVFFRRKQNSGEGYFRGNPRVPLFSFWWWGRDLWIPFPEQGFKISTTRLTTCSYQNTPSCGEGEPIIKQTEVISYKFDIWENVRVGFISSWWWNYLPLPEIELVCALSKLLIMCSCVSQNTKI